MPYDPLNPTDVAALSVELTTDPLGVGYNLTSTTQISKLINDGDANPGGETTGDMLTAQLLMDAIATDPSELDVGGQFSEGDRTFIEWVINFGLLGNPDIERYRAAIEAALPNGTAKSTLQGQSRLQSRAEVLFGIGTVLSKSDIAGAL